MPFAVSVLPLSANVPPESVTVLTTDKGPCSDAPLVLEIVRLFKSVTLFGIITPEPVPLIVRDDVLSILKFVGVPPIAL